jgi:hypothetical protein
MSDPQTNWSEYVASEIPHIASLLAPHHITLDTEQPHTKGERFLMQALTTIGGKKLILLGTQTETGAKVVIKATNDLVGKQELTHERHCRTLLHGMNFSYETFNSPKEILFIEKSGYTIFVSEFIEQTSSFLERPLKEQFTYALNALKAQERTRATTASHIAQIKRVFGTRTSHEYLGMFEAFIYTTNTKYANQKTQTTLQEAYGALVTGQTRIEQYGGFLTHTDFVPHNFRIKDGTLYLLDFSSLRFGNKHESWARFLNFMTLYNPELETLLLTYVEKNRSKEERESLQLMRLFRLGEIVAYYTNTLEKSDGNLLTLNTNRIEFWTDVLVAELHNNRIDSSIRMNYKEKRDALRSVSEKDRQVGLH